MRGSTSNHIIIQPANNMQPQEQHDHNNIVTTYHAQLMNYLHHFPQEKSDQYMANQTEVFHCSY